MKGIKGILMIAAVIIILLMGTGLYFISPMLAMKPAPTGQITGTNIFAVRNTMCSVYFIKTDSGYILIDAGADLKRLESSLNEAGINAAEVKWILLTHSDSDHTAALGIFTNAKIYMNTDEFQLISGSQKRSPFGKNSLPAGIDIGKIIPLSDGQELFFGNVSVTSVKCFKAPGHTPGSMLYLTDGKYLFTGDAFRINGKNLSVHPFTMDSRTGKNTIEKMNETINNGLMILTAHYGLMIK